MTDRFTRGMAAIGSAVSLASATVPGRFLSLFGIGEEDNGAGRLAWRLFAVRTGAVCALAAAGNETAQRAFLPIQVMDQAAWWWGYSRGEIPLRTAASAAAASGAIIALDLKRRAELAA